MRVSNPDFKKLLEKYQKISLLNKINNVLEWDMNVNLPQKGSLGRASQQALLTEITADLWLDREFRNLLEKVSDKKSKLSAEEVAIIRNINWQGNLYFKVPKEILIERARATSEAFMVWQEAKRNNKFKDFLPNLKKNIELNQILAHHLGYKDNPYDALLNLFEPELTTKFCDQTFKVIQPKLTKLLKKIQSSPLYRNEKELVGGDIIYPLSDQKQLALFVLKKMGYDFEAGRIDTSSHPFEATLDRFDVRITTRYNQTNFLESFLSSIHEGGHALYEQGVEEEFTLTPLEGGVSYAIHESQSRFWENQVGRNSNFIEFMTPLFQAFFPEQLSWVGDARLTKIFNNVEPGLIRTEADEVTYNLHIILRYELEEKLINNKIKASDLPEIWREKMKHYIGVVPKTDREGVLQDVHWSAGLFGYFPSYTLGNLYAAQFGAKMRSEVNIDESLKKGEFGSILSWMRSNIHIHGSLIWPKELCKRVTGEELNPEYFLKYIEEKYKVIYKF